MAAAATHPNLECAQNNQLEGERHTRERTAWLSIETHKATPPGTTLTDGCSVCLRS